jgi:hypothetical protein
LLLRAGQVGGRGAELDLLLGQVGGGGLLLDEPGRLLLADLGHPLLDRLDAARGLTDVVQPEQLEGAERSRERAQRDRELGEQPEQWGKRGRDRR